MSASGCGATSTSRTISSTRCQAGIAFEPLCDLETLLQAGVEHDYFRETERQAVLDWRRDPQDWTAKHEVSA